MEENLNTKSLKKSDILYSQLLKAKEMFEKLKAEIKIKENQFNLVFRNTEDPESVDLILSEGYSRYLRSINRIKLYDKDMPNYEDNYAKCKEEIKNIIAYLSTLEHDVEHIQGLAENCLDDMINPKKYALYKNKIKAYTSILYDMPLQIIEEAFNANVVRPEHGEVFNSETMEQFFTTGTEVVDDLKQLRKQKLGTYVDACVEYGAADKDTGKYLITPAVCTYSVELSERYKNFRFVK